MAAGSTGLHFESADRRTTVSFVAAGQAGEGRGCRHAAGAGTSDPFATTHAHQIARSRRPHDGVHDQAPPKHLCSLSIASGASRLPGLLEAGYRRRHSLWRLPCSTQLVAVTLRTVVAAIKWLLPSERHVLFRRRLDLAASSGSSGTPSVILNCCDLPALGLINSRRHRICRSRIKRRPVRPCAAQFKELLDLVLGGGSISCSWSGCIKIGQEAAIASRARRRSSSRSCQSRFSALQL